MAVDIVIYHNPACGTSRNALAMIRNAGIEPHVVEYMKTPPSRALLVELIDRAGLIRIGWGYYFRVGATLTVPVLLVTLAALALRISGQ